MPWCGAGLWQWEWLLLLLPPGKRREWGPAFRIKEVMLNYTFPFPFWHKNIEICGSVLQLTSCCCKMHRVLQCPEISIWLHGMQNYLGISRWVQDTCFLFFHYIFPCNLFKWFFFNNKKMLKGRIAVMTVHLWDSGYWLIIYFVIVCLPIVNIFLTYQIPSLGPVRSCKVYLGTLN